MEARRCTIHGLVAADDGRCVICRRGDASLEAEKPPPTISATTMIIAAGGAALMALFIYGLSRNAGRQAPASKDAAVMQQQPAPRPTPQVAEPTPPRRAPTPPPPPEPVVPTVTEISEDGVTTEDPKLTAAKRRVPIKMYTTPWCTYCKPARTWLARHNYRYTELDIEKSETDKVEMGALNPAMTTPTFNIGGLPVVGFDAEGIESAITRVASARRR